MRRMPHYYSLYKLDGPFPNPFTAGDPLARLPHEAIESFARNKEEHLRLLNEATSKMQKGGIGNRVGADFETALDSLALEACSIAFPVLFNRMLEAGPPSETHLD